MRETALVYVCTERRLSHLSLKCERVFLGPTRPTRVAKRAPLLIEVAPAGIIKMGSQNYSTDDADDDGDVRKTRRGLALG